MRQRYQYATQPGLAEMPSAGRTLTCRRSLPSNAKAAPQLLWCCTLRGQIACECTVCSQDTGCPLPYQVRDKLRGHDNPEVMPAPAGLQEPYIQLQAALVAAPVWRGGMHGFCV